MRIEVPAVIYEWLYSLELLPFTNISSDRVQIQTNDQIYLQNGYSIAALLKKLVPSDSKQYQILLKVRKIAVIKADENWMYLKLVLDSIGYSIDPEDEINLNTVADILDYLYQHYAPPQIQKRALKRRKPHFQFDIVNFQLGKEYSQSKNLLQLMCLLLCKVLSIRPNEAIGMLIGNCKWFKKLIKFGSIKDQYENVIKLYDQFYSVFQLFQMLSSQQSNHLGKFVEALAEGVLSQSSEVCQKALQLFEKLRHNEWMKQTGFRKLLLSEHKQAFNFLLAVAYPQHKYIFSQHLPTYFTDKDQFLNFLLRMIKFLPKHLYGRQIIDALSFDFFVERTLEILDPQQNQQSVETRELARSILCVSIQNYYHKISPVNLKRIQLLGFQYQDYLTLRENLSLLSCLFEIIQHFVVNRSPDTERFFRTSLSYLTMGSPQTQNFTLINLIHVYSRLRSYFPLKCFLSLYSYKDRVVQSVDYQCMQFVANDHDIQEDEVALALDICFQFYSTQLHAQCFLPLISLLLKKDAAEWAMRHIDQFFSLWNSSHPEGLNRTHRNILLRKKTTKQQFGSIGVKRKEMVKTKGYQIYCNLFCVLLGVQNKGFLQYFLTKTRKSLNQIQKGLQNQISILFLKELQKKIMFAIENTRNFEVAYSLLNKVQPTQSEIIKSFSRPKRKSSNLLQIRGGRKNSISGRQKEWQHQESFQISQTLSQLHDEQNQFMSESVFKQGNLRLNVQKEYKPLMSFGEWDHIQTGAIFYGKEVLEQHEVIYLEMLCQQYDNVIEDCAHLHQFYKDLPTFLKALEVDRLIPQQEAEFLWLKCSTYQDGDKEIVQQFLIQLAMFIFSFEKNRGPSLSCVQSFMKKLQKTTSQQSPRRIIQQLKRDKNSQQQKIEKGNQFQMCKSIEFSHRFSDKFEVRQQFLIAISILNDIVKNCWGSSLIEPTSQIMTKIITSSSDLPTIIQQQPDEEEEVIQNMLKQFNQNPTHQLPSTPKPTRRPIKIQKHSKLLEKAHQEYLKAQLINAALKKQKTNSIRETINKNKRDLQKQLKHMGSKALQKSTIENKEQVKEIQQTAKDN